MSDDMSTLCERVGLADNSASGEVILRCMEELSEEGDRQKRFIRAVVARFIEHKTYKEIGEELNVCQKRANQLTKRGVAGLQHHVHAGVPKRMTKVLLLSAISYFMTHGNTGTHDNAFNEDWLAVKTVLINVVKGLDVWELDELVGISARTLNNKYSVQSARVMSRK